VAAGNARLSGQRVVGRELDPFQAEAVRDDLGVRPLEDPELRVAVLLERPVPVEVVRLEVEQHRDAAVQLVHVLELERRELANHPVGVRDRRERRADVACDRHVAARGPEDRAEELGRRRLPVRARDADDRPLGVEPVAELDLAPDRNLTLPRGADESPLAGNAGALDEHLDAVEQPQVVLVPEQPVGANDLDAPALQRLGGRDTGAGEPVDERAPHYARK
jgi:hypothetical protein